MRFIVCSTDTWALWPSEGVVHSQVQRHDSLLVMQEKRAHAALHPISPGGCTDLGSAQRSLVVPLRLARHLETEAHKEEAKSEEARPLRSRTAPHPA